MENRAAQFAPFAALVGYDDAISEATRLTDARTMLSSDEMEELSQCLNQYERTIKLENGDILRIDDIVSISGEVFDKD